MREGPGVGHVMPRGESLFAKERKSWDCSIDSRKRRRNPCSKRRPKGYLEEVRTLVQSGVDVDSRDREQRTALMIASVGRHTDVMAYLLDSGADIHAMDRYGMTALSWASMDTRADAVEMLICTRRGLPDGPRPDPDGLSGRRFGDRRCSYPSRSGPQRPFERRRHPHAQREIQQGQDRQETAAESRGEGIKAAQSNAAVPFPAGLPGFYLLAYTKSRRRSVFAPRFRKFPGSADARWLPRSRTTFEPRESRSTGCMRCPTSSSTPLRTRFSSCRRAPPISRPPFVHDGFSARRSAPGTSGKAVGAPETPVRRPAYTPCPGFRYTGSGDRLRRTSTGCSA